jgi:hypothetical protein
MNVLVRDVWSLYRAFSEGRPSPLAELPIQLADFACWQQRTLRGESLRKLTEFWERQLDGVGLLPELSLPQENPLPRISSYVPCARRRLELSAELTASLEELGRQQQVTLAMLMMTALLALLHRYTGERELGIRFVAAKRHHPETLDLLGWFSDLLVLRVSISGRDAFTELLRRVRHAAVEAYDHQDLPYMLFPGYQTLTTDQFHPSVTFNMPMDLATHMQQEGRPVGAPPPRPREAGPPRPQPITPAQIPFKGGQSLREPGLSVNPRKSGQVLEVELKYEVARYPASLVEELFANYRAILEEAVAQPGRAVADFNLTMEAGCHTPAGSVG